MAGGLVGRGEKNIVTAVRGSRIAIRIAIGLTLGCIFAFLYYPHDVQGRHGIKSFLQVHFKRHKLFIRSTSSESSERVNMLESELADLSSKNDDLKKLVMVLKSELADLSSKNDSLKKLVMDLTKKLMAAEQKNGKAEQQVVVIDEPQKAGPFGAVKGRRTNPVVLPDYAVNPRLAKILKKVAVKNELIVALATSDVKPELEVWFTSIKKVGIPNYLVVALDDGIVDFCKENDVPFYRRDPDKDVDAKLGSNHDVSGLKFKILREFLQLGYSVLLSEVDIVYIQNPFDHIYRDSDIESMSDGHDNMTAYGYDDISDDPSMGVSRWAHTMRIWVYNSGFFYLRPTLPAIELLDRVTDRLSHDPPPSWDQAIFNEELFFPSHPGYVGLHASKRTMDRYMFMNSKTLFKEVRKDDNLKKLKPVIVHVNYHQDKFPRMKAVMELYFDGKQDALEPFPDGSD